MYHNLQAVTECLRVQAGVDKDIACAVGEWNTHVAGECDNGQTFGRSGIKKTVPHMGSSWDYFLMKIAKLLNSNNPFHSSAV